MNGVEVLVLEGTSIGSGVEMPVKLTFKRPDKLRIDVEFQGQFINQAYNGEKGWAINPFSGTTDPIEMAGPQLAAFEAISDMDGPLYNWKEKGFEVTLKGEEEVEGTTTWQIEAKINDEITIDYFLDKENYVIILEKFKIKIQDQLIEQDNFYSNYNEVNGMIMAYERIQKMNGQIASQTTIENIEFNTDVSDSYFDMPEKKVEEEVVEEKPE